MLSNAKSWLQQRDQSGDSHVHVTSVSSDGTVKVAQNELDEFLDAVTSLVRSNDAECRKMALRVLAYASAGHKGLRTYLIDLEPEELMQQHNVGVLACGQCLREPEDIKWFADMLLQRLSDVRQEKRGGVTEWLRAFSRMLMYRERACQNLKTDLCERITKELLLIFTRETGTGSAKFIFR